MAVILYAKMGEENNITASGLQGFMEESRLLTVLDAALDAPSADFLFILEINGILIGSDESYTEERLKRFKVSYITGYRPENMPAEQI